MVSGVVPGEKWRARVRMTEPVETLAKPPRRGHALGIEVASLVLLCALPFALFHWCLPFGAWTIGKDYPVFSTPQQQELLFSLANKSLPLYAPGFAGGQSASALTLGQLFHPLTYLAAIGPGYWDGAALDWNTFFRLLSLGVTHWIWFRLLVALGVRPVVAVAASLVLVYNLRMLDLFRYGAALEAYTGMLLASASVLWAWLRPSRVLPICGVVASTYWLVCSGHPQMMYYGAIGVAVAMLVAPHYAFALGATPRGARRAVLAFYRRIVLCGAGGVALAAAYVLPFYFDFLANNGERVGSDYAWADGYLDSAVGTVNNFFAPLYSNVMGAFGGSALMLLAALVPLAIVRRRVPLVVWALWGFGALLFLHMQGARTPVHRFAWEYLPLAGSFRVAGRVSMLLPLVLTLLVAWLSAGRAGERVRSASALPVGAAALALAGYAWFGGDATREFTKFAAVRINDVPSVAHALVLAGGLAALAGFGIVTWCREGRALRWGGAVALVAGAALSTGASLRYGTWRTEAQPTRTFDALAAEKRASLDYTPDAGHGLFTAVVARQLEHGALEPFLARLCVEARFVAGNDEAYAALGARSSPRLVVLEGDGPDALDADPDVSAGDVRASFSSYNRVDFDVNANRPAWLVFGAPYSPHWRALVDGERVPVLRANGAAHALFVERGRQRVEFRYVSPAAIGGLATSFAALLVLGALALRRRSRGGPPVAALVWSVAVVFAFAGVYGRLYDGEDLELDYAWSEAAMAPATDLAYGRPTTMTSMPFDEHLLHRYGSGRAVDGARTGGGARTRIEQTAAWTVDLGAPLALDHVVVWEGDSAPSVSRSNVRPLVVEGSRDGALWRRLGAWTGARTEDGASIELEGGRGGGPVARYLRIRAGSGSALALDEVEVFGP